MGYTKVNVSSPQSFCNEVFGKGYDVDGYYGYQCWDAWALCVWNLCNGASAPTKPGGGGAIDCWNVSRNYYKNLGWQLITDKSQIQYGDWLVFSGGAYGHIGMAVSNNLGNYVKLLGQNQTGSGNGSPFNIVNFSLNNFVGAFRWPAWSKLVEAPKEDAKPEKAPSKLKPSVVIPTGITLVALATALGMTVPQLLSGDTDGSLSDIPEDQVLTDDQAQDAADAAEEAVKNENDNKTPLELAKERSDPNAEIVTVTKWTGRASDDGTIWTICSNHSSKPVQECVSDTIEKNKETIAIDAAEHNLPADGHWIFVGEQLVIE